MSVDQQAGSAPIQLNFLKWKSVSVADRGMLPMFFVELLQLHLLVSMVNLPRKSPSGKSLNEELFRLGQPMGMSGGDHLDC